MKTFLDENFLLQNASAQQLYHQFAAKMPITDYHCHLSPKDIAEDRQFDNLTQIWLYGDHYKWRAMRTNGIDEKYCTGDASDSEKFTKWAETVPFTLRNPLYHWTHLELSRYFEIDTLLNPASATEIYENASAKLRQKEYSVKNLLRKMNVELVCTTDDPIDSLEYHQKIKQDGFEIKVLPAWRPDKAMAIDQIEAFNSYINNLQVAAQLQINSFTDLINALKIRHQFFNDNGCRLSDHGLDTIFSQDFTNAEIETIFLKARNSEFITAYEIGQFKSAMLYHFAVMDFEKGWVQQFHIGAMRNNNLKMLKNLGPDTGFDSIGDLPIANAMSKFFSKLANENKLAKTIIYNLNPSDNELYATMLGNFQDGSVAGKMQWGSAWWFLDQKFGMENQLNTLSSLGLLSKFVGMLTDSRSFLSYPRHEYFRRILCNLVGTDMENGEIPNDFELAGQLIKDVCYNNAHRYFNM